MKYREEFDHLGNRHYTTRDLEGVFIVIGVACCILIVWSWLS